METNQNDVIAASLAMSPAIGKLAEALASAQAEMPTARKDAKNPHFKNDYASFESVVAAWKSCGPKQGLAIAQLPTSTDGQSVGVTTILMHKSGEFIRSTLVLRPAKADPQGIGSAISYAKRYTFAAVTGLPTGEGEDDGEAAVGRNNGPGRHDPPARPQIAPPPSNRAPEDDRDEVLAMIASCRTREDVDDIKGNVSKFVPKGHAYRDEVVAALTKRHGELKPRAA